MYPKTPSVTCMVLTFLTFSSLTLAYPVSTSKDVVSRAVSSRSPDPRMIPQADTPDDENSDLIDTLFDSIGLHDLTKLNHWKSDNEPAKSDQPDVIDDSNSPTKTVTSQNNDVDQDDDKATDNGKDTKKVADDSTSQNYEKYSDNSKNSKGNTLPNPASDASGFAKALMQKIQDAVKDALDSSDEHTLH
ncbi:similar to An08g02170 [Aspergillus luchuensis]|nr:similar to An08g02170 [Aspergillus luchuensis IFO 4308]GAT29318.1 similar to An08g02170 [Aspergillus luchuensis]